MPSLYCPDAYGTLAPPNPRKPRQLEARVCPGTHPIGGSCNRRWRTTRRGAWTRPNACIGRSSRAPENADAWHLLGLVAYQAGRYPGAENLIRQAIGVDDRRALDIKPDYAETWNNLGAALRQQGEIEEAAAAFARVLAIDPRLVEARNNLGEIYEKTDRLDEAEALLAEAAPEDRARPALRRLAATLLRRRGGSRRRSRN